MGGRAALDGMARHLLRHGVTSFLPTGVSAPLDDLYRFVDDVRDWMPVAPPDGAEPLGSNLEGPWLSPARKGAHDPAFLRSPADLRLADLEAHLDGLRLVTIAPELPGALDLIAWLHARGVATSMGHSASTLEEARAGYAAGGTLDDPPVQRDERRGSSVAGSRRGGPDRRRRLRRADRRRRARPPGRLAAHHPHEAGRPSHARQRRDPARGDGRRSGDGRWPRGGGRRSARHAGRDIDAGRVGDRPR